MKFSLLFFSCFPAVALSGCLPVTGDKILGRDLALANPEFAALPASLVLGFTPTPGMKRIFAAAELARIAKANGVGGTAFSETCFEIPMRKLTIAEAAQAMTKALPSGVELKIVELPPAESPAGDLEFPLGGLEPAAADAHGIQLWRGSVRFTSTRKSPVWARVTIEQRLQAVIADRDLAANAPIEEGAVRVAAWYGPVVRDRVAVRVEDVLGHAPKRPLKAGSLIPLDVLDSAPSVRRGDSVPVEVKSGPAHLTFRAVAQKEGRDGDLMELRNPLTGKTFRARLEGETAVLVLDGGARP